MQVKELKGLREPIEKVAEEGDTLLDALKAGNRALLTEENTDMLLELLDDAVEIPGVPDIIVFKVLDAMLPGALLKMMDHAADKVAG